MNTLRYKGYIGSVSYSEPDKVFFGKIEGIDGLVNYEGESVAELTAAFEEAVEDYLIFCKENNVKPEKSYTGTFNVRIAPLAHREIAKRASEAGISINAFVKQALDKALKEEPRSKARQPFIYDSGTAGAAPAMVMDEGAHYGDDKETLRLRIPAKDLDLAREIARRMGWGIGI